MYEVIYDEMVDANVAIVTLPCFTDAEGTIVDKADCYGRVQTIKITKHGWILKADESGFLTLKKKMGHVSDQSLVVENGKSSIKNGVYNRSQIYLAPPHLSLKSSSLLCGNFSRKTRGGSCQLEDWD
jgi:hypothetical protein